MATLFSPHPEKTKGMTPSGGLRDRTLVALGVIFALSFLIACSTIATGQDPVVVDTERFLKVAPSAFDLAMTFAEQNKAKLPATTLAIFEKVRVNFPGAYRALDNGLQVYRATNSKDPTDVLRMKSDLLSMLSAVQGLITANGGPDLGLGGK